MAPMMAGFALLLLLQLNTNQPFYPNGTYKPGVVTPEKALGYQIGERFTRYDQLEKYYRALAQSTDRMRMEPYGETYEGRTLYTLIFSTPENLQKLEQIRSSVSRLRDPRRLPESEAQRIAESTPAVAFLGYNVHGNEASSAEAAMQVAYQLAAGADEQTLDLLKNLVILIDPLINPDGRERYVAHFNSFSGSASNPDRNAFEHAERWPGGRTNHYYFDLNRDWAWQTQKESKARIKNYLRWNPQVFVDYHEMGSDSTYFFPPPFKPVNKNLPDVLLKWFPIYAEGNSAALDRIGSRYFTREGYDLFFPSYGDSWPSFQGAVGMTYEQAGGGAGGLQIRRDDGTTLTLRDRALNHFSTSIATLQTTAKHRKQRLLDFYGYFKTAIERGQTGKAKQYFLLAGKDPARSRELAEMLASQGIEVSAVERETRVSQLVDYNLKPVGDLTVPRGSFVVDLAQPLGLLANAVLEKEPEIKDIFFYDITAWSLPLAYGVEAYWTETRANIPTVPLASAPAPAQGRVSGRAQAAYAFTMETNNAARLLFKALNEDFRTLVSLKEFKNNGTAFPRGTVLLPVEGNAERLHDRIAQLARDHGVQVQALATYRTEDGIDLGSNRVRVVRKPKIAVVTDAPTNAGDFGALWFLLDQDTKVNFTPIRAEQLGSIDLSEYNVLILPDDTPRGRGYSTALQAGAITRIREWIQRGGTFIGIKGGAIFATKKKAGLASIGYHFVSDRAEEDRIAAEDKEEKNKPPEPSEAEKLKKRLTPYEERESVRRADTIPGAIMKLQIDMSHPLAIGYDGPVTLLNTDSVILELTDKGDNVVYYPESGFWMSGFITPEKEKKLKQTAYLVREPVGRGSVILYADMPAFRTFWESGTRLLLNSILFGTVRDPNVE